MSAHLSPRPGLSLYDSLTRTQAPFEPLTPGQVGIYVCGPTPQGAPHIGHMRAQLVYDVLRRWLEWSGYQVALVRNVTDIDDKILVKAAEQRRPWWAHAYAFEREFTAAYDALRVLPPIYEPRATGHATEMVAYLQRLVAAGHAYVVPAPEDPAGRATADVYFDVASWPPYGELTRQGLADLAPAEDTDPEFAARKRDPRDFALWKAAKPGEPATASWPTPWGWGRPGWHLECSAMATRYLGPGFDIHGGGIDLRFPHHENELAQSRAVGDAFARTWLHSAWITMSGEKMSKTLGNVLGVGNLLRRARPETLRYYLISAHYRSNVEFSLEALAEAGVAWQRLASVLDRVGEWAGPQAVAEPGDLDAGFVAAMDDDLGVPAALAALHGIAHRANVALAAGDGSAAVEAARSVLGMMRVLGVEPAPAGTHGDPRAAQVLDALIRDRLAARAAARDRRDFAAADAIRDQLAASGLVVEDTTDGARWTLAPVQRVDA